MLKQASLFNTMVQVVKQQVICEQNSTHTRTMEEILINFQKQSNVDSNV